MKIVIDIDEDVYEDAMNDIPNGLCKYSNEAIRKGTPLPKGHGRLIDADVYQTKLAEKAKRLNNLDTINGLCGAVALLGDTETIIDADTGDTEE